MKIVRKNTSCSWWWITGKGENKQQRERNQDAILRENINSEREEQLVKPQQRDQ